MLTTRQLADVAASLDHRPVLSAYLRLPAAEEGRHGGAGLLHRQLDAVRRSPAAAAPARRAALEDAAALLLRWQDGFVPAGDDVSAVVFATEDGIAHAERLPVAIAPHLWWAIGPRIAPYVCACSCHRPVVVVIAGAGRARLLHVLGAHVVEHAAVAAPRPSGTGDHAGDAPRPGFHAGTRGETATDAARRRQRARRDRVWREAARRARALAGDDAWVVLGGARPSRVALHALLLPALHDRVLPIPLLTLESSPAEVRDAARDAADLLRALHDRALVDRLVELAGAHGAAVVGRRPSARAVALGTVRQLVIGAPFAARRPDSTETLVRETLSQGGAVLEIAGPAAERLEALGGVGALLRFVPRTEPAVDPWGWLTRLPSSPSESPARG